MLKFKMFLGITLLFLVVLFTLQNVAMVEIQFLLWGFSIPRSLLLFIVLFIGILIGWVMKTIAHDSKKANKDLE